MKYNVSGQALTLSAGGISQAFSHSVVMTNLSPETTYQFTVSSADIAGNQVTSSGSNFTTLR